MNRFLMRIGAAVAGAATFGLVVVPSTLAAGSLSCTISGNGAHSHNTCTIVSVSGGRKHGGSGLTQINYANVSNGVFIYSSTGGNKANENTGGDVTVVSGDSNVNVSITNNLNANIWGAL